jgi:signal transduction histidine kinase
LLRVVAAPMATTWRTRYREHLDALLLERLRWAAGLGALSAAVSAALDAILAGTELGIRLRFAAAYLATSLLALALSGLRWGQRRAAAVTTGFALLLIAIMAVNFTRLDSDARLAPAAFGTVVVGIGVLVPVGRRMHEVIGLAALAGYAWVAADGPAPPNAGAAALVVSLVGVALAAARLIERYRAAWFERTWQQEQLIALARALAGEVEPAGVAAAIVKHAQALVPEGSAVLALRDAARRVYRVEAVAPRAEPHAGVAGLEVPEDLAPIARIVACDVCELPEDDPATPLRDVYAAHGVQRVLYVTLREGDAPVGILSLVRCTEHRFDAGERLLARGIADQAVLALRTARLVADLRQANQLKTEFVSTMSHELRTPLNVILGYAEIAADAARDAAEREAIAHIVQASHQLLELIENTLEIGRIDAGRDAPRLTAVWLPELWAEIGRHCAALPRRETVRLVWEPAPSVRLETDVRKLTVILRNLVGNAGKFTAAGFVRVAAALVADRLVVRVSDTGIGIRPEDQATIFEMFRQVDQSDTRPYAGTGLGLYIVRRFAEQLGGSVEVESSLGHGATFTVTLPVRVLRHEAAAAAWCGQSAAG